MPKLYARPLTKVLLRLYSDDWQALREMFNGTDISANEAVRNIVSAYVKKARESGIAAIDNDPALELDPITDDDLSNFVSESAAAL